MAMGYGQWLQHKIWLVVRCHAGCAARLLSRLPQHFPRQPMSLSDDPIVHMDATVGLTYGHRVRPVVATQNMVGRSLPRRLRGEAAITPPPAFPQAILVPSR